MASGNTRSRQGSGKRSGAGSARRTGGTSGGTRSRSRAGAASGKKRSAGGTRGGAQESALGREILMIVGFAFCILLFLCNFSVMGPFGNAVKGVMFGLFGLLAYVMPVALFVGFAFGISNAGNRAGRRKLIAGIVFLWCIGIFAGVLSVNPEEITGNLIVDLYRQSRESHKGGGLVGGLPAYPMLLYLKKIGSVLVLLVVSMISLVIITERSLIGGVKKGGRRVYDSAKKSAERLREERAHRREEDEEDDDEDERYAEDAFSERDVRERRVDQNSQEAEPRRRAHIRSAEPEEERPALRVEKKVSGVSEDTVLVKKRPELCRGGNMHEITLADLPKDLPESAGAVQEQDLPDEAFAFDLYRSMPEPRGKDIVRDDAETGLGAEETGYAGQGGYIGQTAYTEQSGYAEQTIQTDRSAFAGQNESEGRAAHTGQALRLRQTEPAQSGKAVSAARGGEIRELAAPPEESAGNLPQKPKKYTPPPIRLLKKNTEKGNGDSARQLKETAARLQQTLKTFGVNVTITDISRGPTVTRYEMQPELGVKVSKIVSLADDIKLNLAATDIRIEAPIPGKAAVGIEVPNKENSAVNLRDLLESDAFRSFPSNIAFAVGKDIGGQTVVFDIARMPHVLIAGSTGSGKSVCINTLIMSILYKANPDDVKLIMVDPKVVELSVYNGIPHLLIPVVTDPKKAAAALQWAVAEMTDRYKKFADHNVRDLKGYNKLAESAANPNDPSAPVKMPQIVIIVDELADLMMVASGDVEEAIVRLAQLARAAGIHLVIATQRPSVDVITGLIKANMPSRIAFAVSSGVDSRTILDMNGAEKLLGKGDMLFYPQGYAKPARVQGAFVSDKEVSDVVEFLKNQSSGSGYGAELEEKISHMTAASGDGASSGGGSDMDELFAEAGRFIIEKEKASIGMLQRAFRVGFNRAARIMDQLCDAGVVGEEEGTKPRKILMSMEQFEQYLADH